MATSIPYLPSSTREETRLHIASLMVSFIHFANNRNLSPSEPFWQTHISPTFHVESSTGARPCTQTREAMLAALQSLTSAYPEYRVTITGPLDVELDEKTGAAQVVMNVTSTGTPGLPSGEIGRKAVTVVEFRRFEGVWVAVKEYTMSGIGRMEDGWF